MNALAPSRLTRWIIGILVGAFFALPLISTFLYTLRDDKQGGYSLVHWAALFDPASAGMMKPIWTGLGNSLVLSVVTVVIVLALLAPTMILVHLRFPKLRPYFEFLALLPISIPAIVLVVGLSPIYLQIARMMGTGTWTLAFAYGITVLPFAYRAIQASIDAADLRTLAEAGEGPAVQLQGIVKSYGGTTVLHGVDLDIAPGEFVSLLGPSGCGKTTLLRVLAGLEGSDSGAVRLGGHDVSRVPTNKRDIGMVFQSYSLFPHLRVTENTAFGLRRRGVGKADAAKRALDALALVGLQEHAGKFPHQLSGGQQQRVALARALVTEPKVLLLDEPLSALDAKVRVQLRDEIRRIQLRLGITTVFVTHDQEEALAVSDRIAVMSEGRIEQIGTPEELYGTPATASVAAFVGLSSIVTGKASGTEVQVWGRRLPLQTPATGLVDVYLRPENVAFADEADADAHGTVVQSTFLGSIRRTVVRTDAGEHVTVQHSPRIRPEFGDAVGIRLLSEPVAAEPHAID
jgi:putative spermidine/putrescine transport system ATP-binding protein